MMHGAPTNIYLTVINSLNIGGIPSSSVGLKFPVTSLSDKKHKCQLS